MRPIAGIDHTLVGVRDLEAAGDLWRDMGFTLTPRGRHIGWGTANYCIMFQQGYVELIGVVDASKFTNNLDAFLKEREGLMGLAYASPDADASAACLRAMGLHLESPTDLKRVLELPEGDALPAFRLLRLPPEELPGCPAFICQHLTPGLIRRPSWLGHANGAEALLGVTIVGAAPLEHAPAYIALFGDRAVAIDDGVLRVETGGGFVRFVDEACLARLYPGLGPARQLAPPYMAGMTIAVADTTRAEAELVRHGQHPARSPGGIALAYDAAGAILEFVSRNGGPKR